MIFFIILDARTEKVIMILTIVRLEKNINILDVSPKKIIMIVFIILDERMKKDIMIFTIVRKKIITILDERPTKIIMIVFIIPDDRVRKDIMIFTIITVRALKKIIMIFPITIGRVALLLLQ